MSAAGPPQQPTEGGSGDDPFSWLYRRGETAPTEDEPPVVPATIEPPPPVRPQSAPVPPPVAAPRPLPPPPEPYPQPVSQPVAQPTASYGPPAAAYPSVGSPPRTGPRPGAVIGIIVGALVLAVIAAYVVVAFVLRPADRSVLDPGPRVASSTPAPAYVKPVASGVRADCTAPPATDDSGARVTYQAANVLDGKSSTAWRCNGTGVGHSLTFTFPAGSTIASVGVINGYAKTDPKSGAERYGEYRRITKIRWTFDDGTTMTQQLADGDQKVQTMAVPARRTQTLKLTVEASTEPGSTSSTRNAVLISGVVFS